VLTIGICSILPTEKEEEEKTSTLKKKVAAEKKQREHLLQLNQILAKQVMEKSKMVAGKCDDSECHFLYFCQSRPLGDFMLPAQSFKPYAVHFFYCFANRL
jgi:hypothetical protein